jgi:signal transduction histidine kinase
VLPVERSQLGEGRVEKLDVVEELNMAIDQVFPPALPLGVHVRREFETYFPPLLMYRQHLSQIFLNVLQNARDAMGESGTLLVIALCRPDYTIEVSIADNGPGIPPEKMEQVFEAYYTSKEKGTGLGLAIVKHNVELYAGSVRVESELGKGARFILTVPAKTALDRPNRR